jgi:predicted kinase
MQFRKRQGYVRECHGDLHLSNITLIDGRVTPFDCIEFNPMLRWIDVISEIAFLVMDLLHHGYQGHAFRFLNQYLHYTGDYQGLGLLRYYLAYRAMVRAKVTILRMQQCQPEVYRKERIAFDAFMDLAVRFTRNNQAVLAITHGYSGSGKSTLAEQLAEQISAIQIRSDVERKRLFGYQAQDGTGSGIDSALYTPEATQKTYQYLADLAKAVIDAGFSVIIDAAFLKLWQRELFKQTARERNVRFVILDFCASEQELTRRIQRRKNDASEATVEVLRQQLNSAEPLSKDERAYTLAIATEGDNVLDKLLAGLHNNFLNP